MSLNASISNGPPLFKRQQGDNRVIIKEFPKQVKCLIIHQRFIIDESAVALFSDGNVCVEYTIIRSDYKILPNDQKILIEPSTIIRYILSPNNLMVCQF